MAVIYTVTLNPSLDHTLWLEDVRPGEVNRAGREALTPGGKGINVSVLLSRLGMENTAMGFRAGPTGELLEALLHREGCRCDLVEIPGQTRVNTKLKSGRETDINAPGPEIPPEACEHMVQRLSRIKNGDFLVLAGSVPPSAPGDLYSRLIRLARERGALAVVDAEGDLLLDALPEHPFLIKPNRDELGGLFGRKLESLSEVEEAALDLRCRGARNVLVSLGGEGAFFLPEKGTGSYLPAPHGRIIHTVGAGDSMVAGFLYGWIRFSRNTAEAFRFSICCGSATAFSTGLAGREKIWELYASH